MVSHQSNVRKGIIVRTMAISLVTAAAVAIIPVTGLLGAEQEAKPSTQTLLKKAVDT